MKNYLNRNLFIIFVFISFSVNCAFSQINQKLLASIVSLRQEVTIETIQNPVFDKDDNLISGSVIEKKTDIISRGSGTLITNSGMILTNYHVWNFDTKIEKGKSSKLAYKIRPTMDDMYVFMLDPENVFKEPKKKYIAKYISGDKTKDIVVLKCYVDANTGDKISNLNLDFLSVGNPFGIGLNNKITIAGYPGIGGKTITITDGKFLGYYSDDNCTIKTDAPISYGNSGGAAIYYDKIFGIPTEVSVQQGGANFGYIFPITYAVGPLAKAKIKFKENIPSIDKRWLESSLNAENTKNNLFLGFQIRSALSNQPVQGARVIIYRKDREYEQIEQLYNEFQRVYLIYNIQEYKKQGYTVKSIAKMTETTEADVKEALNIEMSQIQLSEDGGKFIKNEEFFFCRGDSDKDGYYFTAVPIPTGREFNLIVLSENYKKVAKTIKTENNWYQDLGSILLY